LRRTLLKKYGNPFSFEFAAHYVDEFPDFHVSGGDQTSEEASTRILTEKHSVFDKYFELLNPYFSRL